MAGTPTSPDAPDIRAYNREAWDREVAGGNKWTVPVGPEAIAAARNGEWDIVLTPTIPVPREWFGALAGADVLCLASGGGQQGPILAAAGARVTVYDNSPAQLAQDRTVAERDGLTLRTVEGDMRDLGALADASFDLVVHPCSNCFIPDICPVWHEAFRVLRPGGALLSGFTSPVRYIFDHDGLEEGRLDVTRRVPYADTDHPEAVARFTAAGVPLEFGHTLEDQIGGQCAAGFAITAFYEDHFPKGDPISDHLASFYATRAVKPASAADRAT